MFIVYVVLFLVRDSLIVERLIYGLFASVFGWLLWVDLTL